MGAGPAAVLDPTRPQPRVPPRVAPRVLPHVRGGSPLPAGTVCQCVHGQGGGGEYFMGSHNVRYIIVCHVSQNCKYLQNFRKKIDGMGESPGHLQEKATRGARGGEMKGEHGTTLATVESTKIPALKAAGSDEVVHENRKTWKEHTRRGTRGSSDTLHASDEELHGEATGKSAKERAMKADKAGGDRCGD